MNTDLHGVWVGVSAEGLTVGAQIYDQVGYSSRYHTHHDSLQDFILLTEYVPTSKTQQNIHLYYTLISYTGMCLKYVYKVIVK